MNNLKLKAWIQASRPKFFIATLIPIGLGGVIAAQDGNWNTSAWFIILLASFFVHLNTNLANDYFEYFTGADAGDSIGGSRVLQQGAITLTRMRNVIILFYTLALICGLWILYVSNLWWLIAVMLFSFFSSLFYTAPPVRYGYHALGELLVGINMGPVMVAGTASALNAAWSPHAAMISIPVGIMVALILYYQSLSDIDADKSVGKNTVAVRLGRKRIHLGFLLFIAALYLSIIALIVFRYISSAAISAIITIPFAVVTYKMIKNTTDIQALHDKGGPVRLIYLLNGLILILSVLFLY